MLYVACSVGSTVCCIESLPFGVMLRGSVGSCLCVVPDREVREALEFSLSLGHSGCVETAWACCVAGG